MKLNGSYLLLFAALTLLACDSKNKVIISGEGFSNTLSFAIPADWENIESIDQRGLLIRRFAPANETYENQTEFLLVNGGYSIGQDATPTKLFQGMEEAHKEYCQGESIFEYIDSGNISGFASAALIAGCSETPDIIGIENKAFLVLRINIEANNKDFYTFEKGIRGTSLTELSKRLNKDNYKEFMADIEPIMIKKKEN